MQPSEQNAMTRRRGQAWAILGASFLILFFNSGARFSFGVMFKPMLADFGWQRGDISAAFFLNMVVYALSLVVVGRFYDRYGAKWVIIVSTLLLSAGYALTAAIETLWQFFLSYGLLAALGLGGTSVPLIAALMSKWFDKWRGLAISTALCGSSLGQFVLVPLFTTFTLRYNWRVAYLAIGLIMLVVNIVLALLVMREPEEEGTDTPPVDARAVAAGTRFSEIPTPDLDLRAAMQTPSFWFFLIVMFICGGGDFLVATHLIPLVTDYGISPTTAGHMLAWYGLMSLAGILVAGPASDLIGNKTPIALTFLLRLGIFILVLVAQTRTSFYIFALAFGFTHLITAPLTPTLVGKLYGFSHVGHISGFITTVHHLSGGLWAFLGGIIFDWTGSYHLAFLLSALLALLAFGMSLLIAEKRHGVVTLRRGLGA